MPTVMLLPRIPDGVKSPGVFTCCVCSTTVLSAVTEPTRFLGGGASITLRTPANSATAVAWEIGSQAEIMPPRQAESTAMISKPRSRSAAATSSTRFVPSR